MYFQAFYPPKKTLKINSIAACPLWAIRCPEQIGGETSRGTFPQKRISWSFRFWAFEKKEPRKNIKKITQKQQTYFQVSLWIFILNGMLATMNLPVVYILGCQSPPGWHEIFFSARESPTTPTHLPLESWVGAFSRRSKSYTVLRPVVSNILFIFTPILGEMMKFDKYFSNGLKLRTSIRSLSWRRWPKLTLFHVTILAWNQAPMYRAAAQNPPGVVVGGGSFGAFFSIFLM